MRFSQKFVQWILEKAVPSETSPGIPYLNYDEIVLDNPLEFCLEILPEIAHSLEQFLEKSLKVCLKDLLKSPDDTIGDYWKKYWKFQKLQTNILLTILKEISQWYLENCWRIYWRNNLKRKNSGCTSAGIAGRISYKLSEGISKQKPLKYYLENHGVNSAETKKILQDFNLKFLKKTNEDISEKMCFWGKLQKLENSL